MQLFLDAGHTSGWQEDSKRSVWSQAAGSRPRSCMKSSMHSAWNMNTSVQIEVTGWRSFGRKSKNAVRLLLHDQKKRGNCTVPLVLLERGAYCCLLKCWQCSILKVHRHVTWMELKFALFEAWATFALEKHNFNYFSAKQVDTLSLPYDYSSIMHYPPVAFPIYRGQVTIQTKIPEYCTVLYAN